MNPLLFALWFFLPAAVANTAPVFANKIPLLNRWNTPLDMGWHFRGKRIFGDHKTWRGLASGILAASLVASLQYFVQHGHLDINLSGFIANTLAGGLIGLGALVGDAVESFFKRQRNIPSGQVWFPFDQIDYIIGGIIFIYPVFHLSLGAMGIILVVFFGLHLLGTYLGYLLGLRDQPI